MTEVKTQLNTEWPIRLPLKEGGQNEHYSRQQVATKGWWTLQSKIQDSVKYRNRKKHCFLAAAILLFIGKIIITW